MRHRQVWVKVNAQVDEGIAEVVSLLSLLPGLQTIDSCEGEPGRRRAYVYFYYGDWRQVGAFLFDTLASGLQELGHDVFLSLEVFNGSLPMGKLTFSHEAIDLVASLLKTLAPTDSTRDY